MTFANPTAVWALAALAIPIAIHLFSHYKGKQQPFAQVRFIPTAPAEQLRDIRLTERLLLAVRCLLLALLALLLAQPQWSPNPLTQPHTVLLSPLAFEAAGERAISEAQRLASQQQTEARWLALKFPTLADQPTPPAATARSAAWSLLAELQTGIDPNSELTIITADDEAETLWRKPQFIHSIDWHPLADAKLETSSLTVALEAGSNRIEDARYVRAALSALQTAGHVQLSDDPSTADLLITLGSTPCPTGTPQRWQLCDSPMQTTTATTHRFDGRPFDINAVPSVGNGAILSSDDDHVLARAYPQQHQLIFASRFHPEQAAIVRSRYFPDLLWQLINAASPTSAPDEPHCADNDATCNNAAPAQMPTALWLAVLILLAFLAERYLTNSRWAQRISRSADASA